MCPCPCRSDTDGHGQILVYYRINLVHTNLMQYGRCHILLFLLSFKGYWVINKNSLQLNEKKIYGSNNVLVIYVFILSKICSSHVGRHHKVHNTYVSYRFLASLTLLRWKKNGEQQAIEKCMVRVNQCKSLYLAEKCNSSKVKKRFEKEETLFSWYSSAPIRS